MGTDFNIKPVGSPAAASFVQPAPEGPKDAVTTQLPASQSVTAAQLSARVRNDPQTQSDATSRQTVMDRAANMMVYQVVDSRTNLVVRQFPEEAMLRRRAYFRALDLMKDAPGQRRVTDRRA